MNAYTVTFHLSDEQDKAIENLVTRVAGMGWNITKEAMFEMMMKAKSGELIDDRILIYNAKLTETCKNR